MVISIKTNKHDNKRIDFLFFNINDKKESVEKRAIENVVTENKISSRLLKELVMILL